jgi:transposase
MSRPRKVDQHIVQQALAAVRATEDIREMRQAMAVLLPAELKASLEQTARLLGVGRATVPRLQASFRERREPPKKARKNWGGRRRALMNAQEEEQFLKPWIEQAQVGGVLVLSPIRAALAQKLGRPVKTSVVYRLVARHGWRKVAPDTRHPKSDPQVQEDWKKNSRKIWRPC